MASTESERLNIRKVADLAGVSPMTVSRVLNNRPHIKDATRRRVLEVIEEQGFRPNQAARALATRRNSRIGVIVESAVEFGPTSIVRAVENASRTAGFAVSTLALHGGDELTPQDAVDTLIAQGVDALCIVAPRSSSISALRETSIDVPVLVVTPESDPSFLAVAIDQRAGALLAVDHLVELGHRDILHLAGPLDWLDARARERAFHDRALALGIREPRVVVGDWTGDFAYDVARGMREMPQVTAVFAANDDMAMGLIHGLHDLGIRVPQDLSVVGFDDVPVARHFIPPLTTVRQDFRALGSSVLDMLRAAIDDLELPHATLIPPELIVRASTAPPR
ncbi:MAG: LacI family DNA-binding transcriptional regulator [Microbacterium sp.]